MFGGQGTAPVQNMMWQLAASQQDMRMNRPPNPQLHTAPDLMPNNMQVTEYMAIYLKRNSK